MPGHANLVGIDLHEDKRIKTDVRAASTANVNTALPGSTLDGVTLVSGDRVLLKNQTAPAENGIYVWTSGVTALTRSDDANAAVLFVPGFKVFVREGSTFAATYWTFTTTASITLGSTSLTFSPDGGSTFTSEITAMDFKASGVTGATAASRYVGATTSGAPVSGTFVTGDFVVDRTGQFWICTTGGSPGTWISAGFQNPMTTVGDLIIGGSSGAPTRLASGASGTVLTGTGAGSSPIWSTPASGGGSGGSGGTGGSVVPIQTQTLTVSTPSVTFAAPSGFKHLFMTWNARADAASGNNEGLLLRLNGDTGGNYDRVLDDSGGVFLATNQTAIHCGYIANASHTTGYSTSGRVFIPDYLNTTFHKNIFSLARIQSTNRSDNSSGTWKSTSAIGSLTFFPAISTNFIAGSTFTLWGESDTAPTLLTTNSNLIQETVLSAAAATMDVANIPQGYKQLRIEWGARSDQASSPIISIRFNGDSGSNYSSSGQVTSGTATYNQTGQTSMRLSVIPNTGTTSGYFSQGNTVVENYATTGVTRNVSTASYRPDLPAAEFQSGQWTNTANAITSLSFIVAAGSFIAGSYVRVYGEPASAAGPSVGTGTRLRIGSNQSIATATGTAVLWDTEDVDADNQHYTSAANLTGTVSKTAGSATITGSSTAFLTELSVGQIISIPGTAAEQVVVVAIASNTSATVTPALANSASGQTVARLNSPVVFRQPGMYSIEVGCYFAAIASGTVTVQVRLNGSTIIGQTDKAGINASAGYDLVVQRQFQQWDYIEVIVTQGSGGSVNLTADERTHLAVQSRPTVIVAIPYANIQDQKTSGTSGGTFTSGAWRTRDLNTIVTDSAGIISLASNQITLQPGTYRVSILVPAYGVNTHVTRLRNITASSNQLNGMTSRATQSNAQMITSAITGRFTITTATTFEVQHICETTLSADGFGLNAGSRVTGGVDHEVYTNVEIWKEG